MSQTKRWLDKCFTGKILIAENHVFKSEVNNYPNIEILNETLAWKSLGFALEFRQSGKERRETLLIAGQGTAQRWDDLVFSARSLRWRERLFIHNIKLYNNSNLRQKRNKQQKQSRHRPALLVNIISLYKKD